MKTHSETSENTSIIIIDENQLLGLDNNIFQTMVLSSIEEGSKNISVDLSNVKFISSLGIESFLHAYKTCTDNKVNFSLKNVNENVMNVLSALKLNDILNIT
jgi:anti-anti-sigma factor